MQLRDYQSRCLRLSLEHYKSGINRQLAVLATGLGKSAIASAVRAHHGFTRKVLMLVHMETLADQMAGNIHKWNPGLMVGVEMAGRYAAPMCTFVVASVPTLGRKGSERIKRFDPADYDCIIQDECFPAGTLIDGRPIESIRVGDVISSFDESTGKICKEAVVRLFKKPAPQQIVEFTINGVNRALRATTNHPIYTQEGWRNAGTLRSGDSIMLELPKASRRSLSDEGSLGQVSENRESVLLGRMPASGYVSSELKAGAGDGSQLRIEAHEGKQPDAQCGQPIKDAQDIAGYRAQAFGPRRQRDWHDTGSTSASEGTRQRVGAGACDPYGNGISTELQSGYGEPGLETGSRSGWKQPRPLIETGAGSQEGADIVWARVDRVEIQERGGYGEPDGLCPDGYVYNLEVERTHTYFANGVLVHNCHIGLADSFKRVYDHFGLMEPRADGPLFLGITATPNRSDGQGLRALFDLIVFDMGIQKGIESGWLCDLRAMRIKGGADLDKVHTRAGDLAQDELAKEVNTDKRNGMIVKEWFKHAYGRRTLAFTVDVQHALDLAAAFKAHGATFEATWGDDPDKHAKIERYKNGILDGLCNCAVLGIGFDDPQTSCVIPAAPTKSFVKYAQQIGRGTRIADGKLDCLILDPTDNTGKHNLCTISSLLGLPKDLDLKGEKYSKAKEQLDRIAKEFPTANVYDVKSLDQLKSMAETVSLFNVSYPPEISQLSELAWRKSAEGYMIAVGRDIVSITKDLRDEFQVHGWVNAQKAEMSAQNLPGAFNMADRFITEHGGEKRLLARDARWRNDKPTDAQVGLCKKIGLPIPNGATKGQVSAAISAKLGRRVVNA